MEYKINKRNLKLWTLIIIFIAVIAFSYDFPQFWNKGVNWLNTQFPKIKLDKLFSYIGFNEAKIPNFPAIAYHLGLDLKGGTHLIYEADMSQIKENQSEAMQGISDVIERRINIYGVTEPLVQINKSGNDWRLIVDLAGVKNIKDAINMIGETPFLDFREERPQTDTDKILAEQKNNNPQYMNEDPYFTPTNFNGRYLKKAQLAFNPNTYKPEIQIEFTDEGSTLFEKLTEKNINKKLAIYLDGQPISAPVVKEKISGGRAVINGDFTTEEAKKLAQRLNAGALPVPIKLISQETVGATLGEIDLAKSIKAGIYGLIAILLFMILYYKFSGLLAGLALFIYGVLLLAIFKLIPVTLTLSGIAGFVLSLGMAVDANVLIFERIKEEIKKGLSLNIAINEGFKRAWPSIRDGNATTILTALILFWFSSSVIKGFALTLLLGVLMSMLTAILITKTFLKLFIGTKFEKYLKLFV